MIKVRLKNRPTEVLEYHESRIQDLERWGLILEYVDDDITIAECDLSVDHNGNPERVLTWDELQEFFKDM